MTSRLSIAVLLVSMAACSGPITPPAMLQAGAFDAAARITVKPTHLALDGPGPADAETAVVAESGYSGKFTTSAGKCDGVVKASPASGHGPHYTVKVTGIKPGSCTLTFADTHEHKAQLKVTVALPPPPIAGLYFTVNDGTVRELTPKGTVYCLSGTPYNGGCKGSIFYTPNQVAVDKYGNIFVVDGGHNNVQEISRTGKVTTIISGLYEPYGVAVDASENVYVADTYNSVVRKVDASGASSVIGSGLKDPYGLAVDASGNVYVADNGNWAIKKIATTGATTCVAGTPNSSGGCDGTGFHYPEGVAVDSAGEVYVTDSADNAVDVISTTGTVSLLASGFSNPWGIAVDTAGNVYVADFDNKQLKKIAPGGAVTTVGPSFTSPVGVSLDFARNPL
ncbi:MAG: hypothetical protein JO277_00885 [Candidatus Eremiobacteraeota bacterium]|nr:hypothetical protein [Candidatus Eremiobacteraeota bacterium]